LRKAEQTRTPSTEPVPKNKLRRFTVALLASPATIYLAVFFFAPFAIVVLYSLGMINILRQFSLDATLRYYTDFFSSVAPTVFGRSLLMAFATTAACLLLGYPLSYYIAVKGGRQKETLMLLVIIPFWVSFLLRTYALMTILDVNGIINVTLLSLGLISQPLNLMYNAQAVLLGMIYNYLPFMILPLYASMEKLDQSLLEAAGSLGAGPIKSFLNVTLPLTMSGIGAGSILVFVPSVGEFIIPQLLGGTESFMIGNLVWTLFLKARNLWFGSSVSIVLIALVVLMVGLYMKYITKGEEMAI
jgi:spermidine/putrescine transport system permease protein